MPTGTSTKRGSGGGGGTTTGMPPFMKSLRARRLEETCRENNVAGGVYYYSEDESDAFDLRFVCSDGSVSAHRMVISNVSKYIMSMLDDQPPWYPTVIHVEDLPKQIVQILVDLAYTGEMRFPVEMQSDVIDAMQALGWIHTDCLSSHFYDPDNPEQDVLTKREPEETESISSIAKPITSKDNNSSTINSEGNEEDSMSAVLTMSFPVAAARQEASVRRSPSPSEKTERVSFNEDADESMEISNLPDIDFSDGEEEGGSESGSISTARRSVRRSLAKTYESGRRLSAQNDADLNAESKQSLCTTSSATKLDISVPNVNDINENNQPDFADKDSGKSPERRSSRRPSRRASFSEPNPHADADEPLVSKKEQQDNVEKADSKKSLGRKTRKPSSLASDENGSGLSGHSSEVKQGIQTKIMNSDDSSQVSVTSIVSEDSSTFGSPSKRQRRKPKRFEEYEVEDSTPKSPTKAQLDSPRRKKKEPLITLKVEELSSADVAIVSDSVAQGSPKRRRSSSVDFNGSSGTPKTVIENKGRRGKKTLQTTVTSSKDAELADPTIVQIVNTDDGTGTGNTKVTRTPFKSSGKRKSTERPKNTLITNYFTKQSPRNSDDSMSLGNSTTPHSQNNEVKCGQMNSVGIIGSADSTETASVGSESSDSLQIISATTKDEPSSNKNESKRTRAKNSSKEDKLSKCIASPDMTTETTRIRRKKPTGSVQVDISATEVEPKVKKSAKGKKGSTASSSNAIGTSAEKRDKKKRSFDEISDLGEIVESTEGESAAGANTATANVRPGRKSSRVTKTSQNLIVDADEDDDGEEGKNGEQESPKRKRTRKEVAVAENSAPPLEPGTSKRGAKK